MPAKTWKTLEVRNRTQWRNWLKKNHATETDIWLVFYKNHAGRPSVDYEDAVEEALCFGWIDSLVRRLDDDRYARKFTPRKLDSKWSTINRQRYESLKARGLLAEPGLQRPPNKWDGDAPRPSLTALPGYIETRLRAESQVWNNFESLAPSCKRAYIAWIDSAKRDETKQKRLAEAIIMIQNGKKLGLK